MYVCLLQYSVSLGVLFAIGWCSVICLSRLYLGMHSALVRISQLNNTFMVLWLTFNKQTNKLHGLSPRANYTDRATAACRRSDCQLLRIKGAMWSV
jgi:hypothetical protein